MTPLYSRTKLSSYLKEQKIHLSKKRGQNFLIDQNLLYKLVQATKIEKNDYIVEIGGGLGHLTSFIIETGAKIIVFEIDRKLAHLLKERFSHKSQANVIWEDFLKASFKDLFSKEVSPNRFSNEKKVKILANIPYSITTPILEKCFQNISFIQSMTLTVQKELGERMLAQPGTSQYCSLSVFCYHFSKPRLLFPVSKNAFFPVPKIESIAIFFDTSLNPKLKLLNEKLFFQIVKGVFSTRRKTVYNSLKKNPFVYLTDNQIIKTLEECSIDPMVRGETLSPELYAELANKFYKCKEKNEKT